MTEKFDDIVATLNINKVLIAILETLGNVTVPTLTFIDAAKSDKELVISYDEEKVAFIFGLKDNTKNDEQ